MATVLQNVGKLKLIRLDDEFVFRLYSKIQKRLLKPFEFSNTDEGRIRIIKVTIVKTQ